MYLTIGAASITTPSLTTIAHMKCGALMNTVDIVILHAHIQIMIFHLVTTSLAIRKGLFPSVNTEPPLHLFLNCLADGLLSKAASKYPLESTTAQSTTLPVLSFLLYIFFSHISESSICTIPIF